MKRIKLLVIILICLFVVNVKADSGAPIIISHKVMVTNKNGAQCYETPDGTKEDRVIKYGTTLTVYTDIDGKYIYVDAGDYNCYVKYVDVSSKTQSFDVNNSEVEKITPMKAIVLASGGLNLRKGPSVTYSTITTIPQYTVVTLSRQAGTYWYYTEYNGKSGWLTSMNDYIASEGKEVLINNVKVNIYDKEGTKVLGTIPANTEITDYLEMPNELRYYVVYNGIKGYVDSMMYKVDSPGKIKLTKDYVINDTNNQPVKKITAGQVLEYTMVYEGDFYIPDKKEVLSIETSGYEYVTEAKISIKNRGYLGEGLFGEAKTKESGTVTPEPTNEEEPKETNEKRMSPRDIIIIGLLAGIFLALTALVIIKLVNSKDKTKKVISNDKMQKDDKEKKN